MDRIGWSGRLIDSDSEDEDALEREEMSQGSQSNYGEDISNALAKENRDNHHNDGAQYKGEVGEDEGTEETLSDEERYAEESVMEVLAALVFFIVVQGGVLCIVRLIV